MHNNNEGVRVSWLFDSAQQIANSLFDLARNTILGTVEAQYHNRLTYKVSSIDLEEGQNYPVGDPLHYIFAMLQAFDSKNTKLYKQHIRDHIRFTEVINRGQVVAPQLKLNQESMSDTLQLKLKKNQDTLASQLREENIDDTLRAVQEYLHRLGKNWVKESDNINYIKSLIGHLSQGIFAEVIMVLMNNFNTRTIINGEFQAVASFPPQIALPARMAYNFSNGVITIDYGMDFVCSPEDGMRSEEEMLRLKDYKASDLNLSVITRVNLNCLTHVAGQLNQSNQSLIEQEVVITGNNAEFSCKDPELAARFSEYEKNAMQDRSGFVFVI